jgi:hypothetical protein
MDVTFSVEFGIFGLGSWGWLTMKNNDMMAFLCVMEKSKTYVSRAKKITLLDIKNIPSTPIIKVGFTSLIAILRLIIIKSI